MIRSLLSLWMVFSALGSSLPAETRTVFAMKTGILLRMHVVAQDDTDEMQRIKLCVRDAVQEAYAQAGGSGAMLPRAAAMLPRLTLAARNAAAREGFAGRVSVKIEKVHFDRRSLDGFTFPEGEYPALMIRLGDARGRNWWGLIDPDLALHCAGLEDLPHWDWSLRGFLRALMGWGVFAFE